MSMERRVRFELLYGEHAPVVKAYILRRAQPSVADDLVAEVFMVCWRRLDKLPAEPLPWLLGVARRVLSTQRRGERRGVALHRRLAESGTPQPAGGARPPVVDSAGVALREALEQLSESDREIGGHGRPVALERRLQPRPQHRRRRLRRHVVGGRRAGSAVCRQHVPPARAGGGITPPRMDRRQRRDATRTAHVVGTHRQTPPRGLRTRQLPRLDRNLE